MDAGKPMDDKDVYQDTIVSIKTYSKEEYVKLIGLLCKFPFELVINPERINIDQ
jgi:hypothetical protein